MAYLKSNFSNANGITFGTQSSSNGNVVTASYNSTQFQATGNYLTTARASNDAIGLNTALTGNGVSWTVNSSGLSLNVPAYLTTAQPVGAYLTTARASNDAVGLNTAQTNVTWTVNSSGISFNAGAYLTTAAQSNHSHNFATTTTNGSLIVVATTNSAGATIAVPAYLTTAQAPGAYLTTARASNDGIGLNTAQTNVTWTVNSSGISFNGAGYAGTGTSATNASITINSNGLAISVGAPAAGVGIVAGTRTATTAGNLLFDNANGITFGLNLVGGSIMTASHNAITTARASNDGIGLNTAQTNVTWTVNSGGISFNATGYAGTGTTFNGTNISASLTQNSNGIRIDASVAAPGGGAAFTYSYHNIVPFPNATHTTSWGQSTSGVYPFQIPGALSMGIVRMLYSGSVAASSTQATTGGTSLSLSGATSHNLVFYSRGVNGSSLSLQYVTSTQHVDLQQITISYAANSTQLSYSNRLTLGSNSFTKDYSSSAASQNYHTSNLTDLTGARYLDIPSGLSLSQGQWWVAYGRSTASATQNGSVSVATRMLVSHNSMFGVSMNTLAIGMIGGNTNSSVGFFPAHGSFTLGGAAGTTSSIGMANVSTAASNHMLHMQFMRIT